MRIIAGEYRGRNIKSPSDYKTRPTSDRLRESVFNILNPQITNNTFFLDLCAGTGAVGIEALSRKAGFATFVDKSRRACGLIEENLDLLQIPETQTEVICSSAEKFVARESEKAWDIIFYDPPYQINYGIVLFNIGEKSSNLLKTDGVLIVQHHFKNILPDAVVNIRRWRTLKQGESQLSFYETR
jgi:16S rRNA (guanine(966)-N(2))-methyltransferase RsmD